MTLYLLLPLHVNTGIRVHQQLLAVGSTVVWSTAFRRKETNLDIPPEGGTPKRVSAVFKAQIISSQRPADARGGAVEAKCQYPS
jgi:hypothetical protein